MKKILLFIFYSIIFVFFLHSINFFNDLIEGEYSYYLDLRGKPHYQGYLYLKDDNKNHVFIIRSIDLIDKNETIYQITFKNEDSVQINEPNVKVILGKATKESYQTICDLINYFEFYNNNINKIENDKEIDDPWPEFKYTLKHVYNNYLPLFKLMHVRHEKDNEPKYFIDRDGILKFDDLKKFYKIYPISNNLINNKQPFKIIPKSEKQIIEMNNMLIELDKNWEFNNTLSFPSYWLKLATDRDSQIGIEKGSFKIFKEKGYKNLFEVVKFNLLFRRDVILLNTLKVTEKDNYISIRYILLDNNNVPNLIREVVPF
jgi:hypothetical protein